MARRASPGWIEALRESEEVSQLVYALSLAERFYFASIVCATPTVADAALEALVDRVSAERGAPIRLVRLDPYGGYETPGEPIPFTRVVRGVLERLVSPAPEERSADVAFVVDASHALPHDYAWGTMFQRMNERRNTIVQALAGPLLLCVPPWLEPVFARSAPDFWSICSLAVVVKAAPPGEAPAAAPQAAPGLPVEGIVAVHAAAVNLRLDRGALLAGIDPSYLASLPAGTSAVAQLLLDLEAMNGVGRLVDGTVPLQRWLQNAALLAGPRVEVRVFERWLSALAGQVQHLPPRVSLARLRGGEARISIARLPVTTGVLFGREAELAWLDRCWEQGVHVACVVAFGGVGKSALVNRWLASMRDAGWRGAGRVFGWSFYSQGTDRLGSADELIAKALEDLGDPDPARGSPWDKGERLAALVRRERTILVLDGVEPLQWGPGVQAGRLKDPALQALVKELGAQNTGLCLITTRIAVADLEGLEGDKVQTHGLDRLSKEAGADLLKARGARGAEEGLRAAAEEYEGHSLALTLLGTYLRKAHRGDIRKRDLIPPLAGKPAQRMMATYERWFEDKPELSILRMLGLFDRPADEDEIAAVREAPAIEGLTDALERLPRDAWNEAVTALRDVGLLAGGSETEEAERLDAHPLVREHFGEQLRREKPEAWREGHRRLYVYLKGKAKPRPETIEEMAPLYAAVVHGCLAGKNQEALDEVWWERIRRKNEGFSIKKLGAFGSEVAVLSAFFDPPWERLAPGLSDADGAVVLNNAGFALRALGRLPEATGLMRMGLDRRIAQEDWRNAAIGASNLSELLRSHGDLREALEQARKCVELADRSGDAFQRTGNRTTLAAALHAMGLRDEAAAQFEEAERMQKERETANPLLYSLQGFRYCDLLLDQGLDVDVLDRAVRMLASVPSWYSLLDIALDHLSLGRAHLLHAQRGAAGDLDEAASHLAASIDGLRRAGQQDYLPLGLLTRATLRTHTRSFTLARHDLDEALALAQRCGLRLHEADAHLGHARLALAEGHPEPAREHLAAARHLIDETGYHRRDGELRDLEALCS